jgi:superfamily II DNA helicase RecQ
MTFPDSDDDEYSINSSEGAELLALADMVEASQTPPGMKRKANDLDHPPQKRAALEQNHYVSAARVLKEKFGMDGFRLKQQQVIATLLGGQSAAVVFPTGGGKSLCYQIPALCFSEEDKISDPAGGRDGGITLVVSPLLALMKDQVDALVRRGIKAATFDSTKTREEYLQTCDMIREGHLKILYCAPERLNNEGFIEQMKHVRGGVRLLAVDEAHCISEWGHAFRPDYLSRLQIREHHNFLTFYRNRTFCEGNLRGTGYLSYSNSNPTSCHRHLQGI